MILNDIISGLNSNSSDIECIKRILSNLSDIDLQIKRIQFNFYMAQRKALETKDQREKRLKQMRIHNMQVWHTMNPSKRKEKLDKLKQYNHEHRKDPEYRKREVLINRIWEQNLTEVQKERRYKKHYEYSVRKLYINDTKNPRKLLQTYSKFIFS